MIVLYQNMEEYEDNYDLSLVCPFNVWFLDTWTKNCIRDRSGVKRELNRILVDI